MSSPKDDLFTQAMQEVKPLEHKAKVQLNNTTARKTYRPDIHKQNIANTIYNHKPSKARLKEADSPWVLHANGIAPDTLKKLANGQFPIDQHLDLHGMTRDKALQALEELVLTSLQQSYRVLCVIHGRGLHSPDGRPVLKNSVYQWLKTEPISAHILAVTPVLNTAGGSCFILLRRDKQI